MTKINREQFRNEFHDGINIDSLSNETRTALKNAGISKARLKEIANGDRKIEGAEIEKLFDVMDSFDMQPSDGYHDTSINPGISTPTGEAYDLLKSEYDRNVAINILRGPQLQNSKPDSTNPKVSLFDGHNHEKSIAKKGHHISHIHKPKVDLDPKKTLKDLGYNFTKQDFQKALEKGETITLMQFILADFPDAKTTFLSAAESGDTKTVKALLAVGMDPNIHDKYGRTPLMLAFTNDTAEALIDANADTSARDKNGKTVLMYQAESSAGLPAKLMKNILEKGSIDDTDKSGKTALMYAAAAGNTVVLDQLITDGAYINAKDKGNSTVMTYAVANGWTNTAEFLLQKGVSPQSGWSEEGNEAPLVIAIRNQDKKMVELLLNNPDIDVDVFDAGSKFSETALDIAIAEGTDDIVQLLKNKGAHRLEDF